MICDFSIILKYCLYLLFHYRSQMFTFLNLSKCPTAASQHLTRRMIFLQAPLENHNKVTRALNPWDEKIALEGTGKEMHWPSYNER